MIIKSVDLKVAVAKSGYPNTNIEFAFVGRSNVGKSSLINTLLKRKIARTSQSPGKTRTINFYNIIGKTENVENYEFTFVDLPGYGYAKVSKAESAKWTPMIESYLKEREQLKTIFLLLDIRHEPTKNDIQMFEWFNYFGHNTIPVATKLDKIKRSQVPKHLKVIKNTIGFDGDILTFSSLEKKGAEELWGKVIKTLSK
ncbi:MAG: ribosome biogenesis GTP-binding protein YihA/YsxC [Defluviitaleaceae bacterium]|nr:ribosome biogenesis GTP-binding protein YihA/YsxC [Defluviitaleaceae bacterium]